MADQFNLRYDVPDDANGGRYRIAIEYDEDECRFYVLDASDAAHEAEGEDGDWVEIGDWRAASLWLARQLRALSQPIMFGLVGEEENVSGPDVGHVTTRRLARRPVLPET
jgi:hypothetical protein